MILKPGPSLGIYFAKLGKTGIFNERLKQEEILIGVAATLVSKTLIRLFLFWTLVADRPEAFLHLVKHGISYVQLLPIILKLNFK